MVNAPDVYRVARRELGPWLRASGFRRSAPDTRPYVKAGLWVKPLMPSDKERRPHRLVLALQAGAYGWSPTAGGAFTVELEAGRRERYWATLNDVEREAVRELNLRVLDELPSWELTDRLRRQVADAGSNDDVWLHYASESDLTTWMGVLSALVPDLLTRLGRAGSIRKEFETTTVR